ncbi:hypothetical protein B0H10DRAFT_1941827 [Mycena sp. CBHHK59/15]|nr:hypothetical protein B0H10DRAFT_1941827 [Mycena sp. CBHHK59/15]
MSTTSLAPFSTVSECRSLVALVFAPLVVVLALIVTTLILTSPIIPPPFSAGQWLWYYCACVGLHLIFFMTPPMLAQIGMLPPLARITTFVEYAGRFAKEGYGTVYVTAVINYFLGQFYSGQIGIAEFLEHMWVKVGHAADLPSAGRGIPNATSARRISGFSVFTRINRRSQDKQAYLDCSCHVVHEEYWWLKKLGSFGEVVACVCSMLDALGESDVPRLLLILLREDLGDTWYLITYIAARSMLERFEP